MEPTQERKREICEAIKDTKEADNLDSFYLLVDVKQSELKFLMKQWIPEAACPCADLWLSENLTPSRLLKMSEVWVWNDVDFPCPITGLPRKAELVDECPGVLSKFIYKYNYDARQQNIGTAQHASATDPRLEGTRYNGQTKCPDCGSSNPVGQTCFACSVKTDPRESEER